MKLLVFMAGCWAGNNGPQQFEEMWMKPAAGSMLGVSRTVAGGKTVFTEHMQIREESGVVTMYVQLRLAQKATPFRLTSQTESEAIFSNPEHDFPQRIQYRRQADGSLAARIDGKEGGKEKFEDFLFRPASCR